MHDVLLEAFIGCTTRRFLNKGNAYVRLGLKKKVQDNVFEILEKLINFQEVPIQRLNWHFTLSHLL